mmetsp:Transcript_1680/g.3598  ORF Transcript_1680/g.3598 Transcript_1680/m.3598 type:complete len:600 (+) Transcript_1680:61-1860(+)
MSLLEKARSALALPLEFDGIVAQIVSLLDIEPLKEVPALIEFIAEVFQDEHASPTCKILAFELLCRCTVVPIFLEAVSEGMIRDLYKVACNETFIAKAQSSFFDSPKLTKRFVKALSKRFVWMFVTSLQHWVEFQGGGVENRLYRYLQRSIRKGMSNDVPEPLENLELSRLLKEELSYCNYLIERGLNSIRRSAVDFEEVGKLELAISNYKKKIDRYASLQELDPPCLHAYYLSVLDLCKTLDELEDFQKNERPMLQGRSNKANIRSSEDFDKVVGRRLLDVPVDYALLKPVLKTRDENIVQCPSPLAEPPTKPPPNIDPPSPTIKRQLNILHSAQFTVSIQEKLRIQKNRMAKFQRSLLSNDSMQNSLEQDLNAAKEHIDMKMYEMNTLKKIIYSQDVHRTELATAKKELEACSSLLENLRVEFESKVAIIEELKAKRKARAQVHDTPVQIKFIDCSLPLRDAIQDLNESIGADFNSQMSEGYDLGVEAECTLTNSINEFKVNLHGNYEAELKTTESPPLVINWPNAASGQDLVEVPNEGSYRKRMNQSIIVKSFMSHRDDVSSSSAPVTPKGKVVVGENDPTPWHVFKVNGDSKRRF